MADLLRFDFINSLPQLYVVMWGDDIKWPLYDIDVETGLLRIDVVGKLQPMHISDVKTFIDDHGDTHDPDTFYCDQTVDTFNS